MSIPTLSDVEHVAAAIRSDQQALWAAGDFAVIGTTLQPVGESLAEAADIRAGDRALDIAAGNGNATLAAARRFADVTSTDFVPALLDKARARAAAEGHRVRFQVAEWRVERRAFKFRYRSAEHWMQVFRDCDGPTRQGFLALEGTARQALHDDVMALLDDLNIGGARSLVVPSEYLEIVITKRKGKV